MVKSYELNGNDDFMADFITDLITINAERPGNIFLE